MTNQKTPLPAACGGDAGRDERVERDGEGNPAAPQAEHDAAGLVREPQGDERRCGHTYKSDSQTLDEAPDVERRDVGARQGGNEAAHDNAKGGDGDGPPQAELAADEGGGEREHDADERDAGHEHAESRSVEHEAASGADVGDIDEVQGDVHQLELAQWGREAHEKGDDPDDPGIARGLFLIAVDIRFSVRSWLLESSAVFLHCSHLL